MDKIKTISFLDNTSVHLPHLMADCDRNNLHLKKLIVTDQFIHYKFNNDITIAWLLEPECIYPHSYNFIRQNYSNYTYVLTHTKSLIDTIPNSIFYSFGQTFINNCDFKIYEKNKNLSMIASDKKLCQGHLFRHKIRDFIKNKADVFGRGLNAIDYKLDGLKDYRYSIAMENSKHDYYFTEKLIDCFLTGTIPVYWGCPGIGKFFNLDGMVIFDTLEDLNQSLHLINEENYNKNKSAIEQNFELAKKYINTYEDIYKFVDSL